MSDKNSVRGVEYVILLFLHHLLVPDGDMHTAPISLGRVLASIFTLASVIPVLKESIGDSFSY